MYRANGYRVTYQGGAFTCRGESPSFGDVEDVIGYYQMEYETLGTYDIDTEHPMIVDFTKRDQDDQAVQLMVIIPKGLENSEEVVLRILDEFEEFMEVRLPCQVDQSKRIIEW